MNMLNMDSMSVTLTDFCLDLGIVGNEHPTGKFG